MKKCRVILSTFRTSCEELLGTHWGTDYIQDDFQDYMGLDLELYGQFVDVPDKLRRIVKHTKCEPSVTDARENTVDEFRVPALYQGLEAKIEKAVRAKPWGN